MSKPVAPSAISLSEQIAHANDSGRRPVVFIHGLWLLPSSWDRWASVFAAAGYAPVSPGWPDDPDTVVSFPDSMTLSGWTIHNIVPYQQQYPGGTTLDFGARPETPKAATVGELRKLTNSDSR